MTWEERAEHLEQLPVDDLGQIDTALNQVHELLDDMASELDRLRP